VGFAIAATRHPSGPGVLPKFSFVKASCHRACYKSILPCLPLR
jgi:hypothetical protein